MESWEVAREEPTWMKRNVHRAIAEGVIRRSEARELLGEEISDLSASTSERLEMMQMTREERRRLLEQSVAESLEGYEVDSEWLESDLPHHEVST